MTAVWITVAVMLLVGTLTEVPVAGSQVTQLHLCTAQPALSSCGKHLPWPGGGGIAGFRNARCCASCPHYTAGAAALLNIGSALGLRQCCTLFARDLDNAGTGAALE